jgi:hypothetical protein
MFAIAMVALFWNHGHGRGCIHFDGSIEGLDSPSLDHRSAAYLVRAAGIMARASGLFSPLLAGADFDKPAHVDKITHQEAPSTRDR